MQNIYPSTKHLGLPHGNRYVFKMQRPAAEVQPLCQGKLCKNFTAKTLAVKVCHHRDCQNSNNGNPLVLCLDCDKATHVGISKNHARFDLKGNESSERMSSSKIAESDSGAEDDQEPAVPIYQDRVKSKSQSARRRFMKLTSDNVKKKPRRHNTDDPGREFIRLKIYAADSGDFHLEMIPALKGKTLKESLEPMLEKYNITFESHSVFLDASNTPLPLAFEAFPLSGNILHLRDNSCVNVDKRVRDISKNFESKPQQEQPVSRTPSFTKRNQKEEKERDAIGREDEKESEESVKKGKKAATTPADGEDRSLSSSSSGNNLMSGAQKGKPAGILTGLFIGNPSALAKGKELSVVRSLPEILQYFTVHGLESESKTSSSTEQEFYLEDSWTKVVHDSVELSKTVRDQQEAIWELLSTEVAYINKLQVIKKIFILCLRNIQSEGYLQEIDLPSLFSNIEEIYAVNVSFWLRCLKPVVNMARHTNKLLNPFYMTDGFSTFNSQFEPYLKYCMEESSCSKYFKQKQGEDELFKLYVEWCEGRPECKRLKLSDLLVKPMQRMTKYPLLLKAILKKTTDEDRRKEITAMISAVQTFVGKVDASMKIRHERENLNKAAVKIESYWPMDPVTDEVEKILIDNYCEFDLSRPMPGASRDQHRCLLHKGPLRLTEKQGRMDIHAFVFTDMILLTKPKKADKFKVVKAPLRINKVKVHVLKDPGTFLLVYLNEYRIVVSAYVLQANSNMAQAKWLEMINKAKNLFNAVLQSDGSKCLTADDAGVQSPASTPNSSPRIKHKRPSWQTSTESLDVPMVTVTTSPKLQRHLSGSDGNLALVGLSDHSHTSSIIRRASCNERKSKAKPDYSHRRQRSDSKITRSTSDPHNKPARSDILHAGGLSRSSSSPQAPRPLAGKDLHMLVESSVDLESPRSTTSLSEVDLLESVDVDEIQMSLSPDAESSNSSIADSAKSAPVSPTNSVPTSEDTRPASVESRTSGRESSEKLKLLLAQKLSKTSNSKKDSEKGDDSSNSHETTRRVPRSQTDRRRIPRSSSVDRVKRTGEHKIPGDSISGFDSGILMSSLESKGMEGRKSKLARSSSGSRQLPDPSQISGKNRHSAKSGCPEGSNAAESTSKSENCDLENNVVANDGTSSNNFEVKRQLDTGGSGSSSTQAPPIKAPLITGLALSRSGGSNGTDGARKRGAHLPKRSSPVMYRKSTADSVGRKSMDEQLLEEKSSPPLRRAKSEADKPVETLLSKSKNFERSNCKNSEGTHSKNSEGGHSKNSEGSHSKNSEGSHSRNSEGSHSKNSDDKNSRNSEGVQSKSRGAGASSEEREKTRARSRKPSVDHDSTHRSSAGDDATSVVSKKSQNSFQDTRDTNSNEVSRKSVGSLEKGGGDTVKSGEGTGTKTKRQMKKYRGREGRRPAADGLGQVSTGESVSSRRDKLPLVVDPLMLESSEYV